MADLRIVDAPVLLQESITDDVKMPTGGLGNFSIRLGDIVWYVVDKENLANKNYVDTSSKGVKDSLDVHIADKANPHQVTKAQVGLGNVDNTADVDKPVSNAVNSAIITATTDMATKTYVNQKDNLKADKATTLSGYGIADAYTKNETRSKSEIDDVLSLKADVSYVNNKDGDLATLATTDKTNLVKAINEIHNNTKGVGALYEKNVEAGAGANGWTATLVTDASGKTQQEVNDLNLSDNPVGLFGINGSGDETAKFQTLLDTLPKNITLDPTKTYNITEKLFVKSDCVIDGQGATINCTAPISTPEMQGSNITKLTKGDFTITVSDASIFSVFEDILVYYNEDNSDTWYTNNQLNFDELGITTQKNQILGISGNVLTLKFANESKLSDIPARTSTVYKIPQNEVIIKNVTFNITASSWIWLRCSGIRHQNCKFKKAGGSISGFSNQMCYKPTFFDCEIGEGLSLGFNYGTYNWYAERNTFYAGRSSDGLLVTYAGTNFGKSRSNKFLVRNMQALAGNAGLYWGAKSRNCHSYDDVVVGLDYGFRVMFGAQQCSINNMTTKNIGTFTGFVSYASIEINDITGFDKPIRTINAENLTIRGGFLFNTNPETTPLLLDLNRNLTSDIRNNYCIDGLHCDGKARIWLGVNKFNILNSYFKQFEHYASAVSTGWGIHGNTVGSMLLSLARDFKINGNTIDESLVPGGTPYGLQFRAHCHVSCFDGNTIKHSLVGISIELENSHIYLAHGSNNIIAPTAMNSYLPSPPTNAELNSLCGDGFKMLHSNFFTKGGVWTKRNVGWVLNIGEATYDPPSIAAGASVTTTIILTGAAIGDAVYASFSQYNANIEISAAVSSSNTVTVKFKNTGAAPVDLASGTLTVKLI